MSETRRSPIAAGVYNLQGGGLIWRKPAGKWPWRDFLTGDERETLAAADAAKATWQALNRERAAITNRAIQRAKYHAAPPVTGELDE